MRAPNDVIEMKESRGFNKLSMDLSLPTGHEIVKRDLLWQGVSHLMDAIRGAKKPKIKTLAIA